MVLAPLKVANWESSWQTPWRSPEIPAEIKTSVEKMQLYRALTHVPMIYAVAIFNLVLVMILCAHEGVEPIYYGWMGIFAAGCAARMIMWMRYQDKEDLNVDPAKTLKTLTVISVGIIVFLSVWSVFAISTDMFANQIFIPMSLVFGSTCIAHCLACIKRASVAVLFVGVIPSALALVLMGGFDKIIMGCSMITIALLMIRFITDSYNQIISGLIMRHTIWKQAHSDPLTGLANRRAMMDYLRQAEVSHADNQRGFAVALLDLNSFKQVNDSLGHDVGDDLLIEVANRLTQNSTADEVVARLGGDEFLMLIPDVVKHEQVLIRATAYLAALAKPAKIKGHVLTPSASIGVAVQALDGDGVEQLLKAADNALYEMKRAGKRGEELTTDRSIATSNSALG